MREAHPATIARPKLATPIGGGVAICFAEIIDKQLLNLICTTRNSDLTNVNNNVIVVIVRLDVRKILDM
jgi:hypothetical protein